MKIKFIKGSREGEIVDVPDKRAAYWQRMGLVEEWYGPTGPKKGENKSNPEVFPPKKKSKKKGG